MMPRLQLTLRAGRPRHTPPSPAAPARKGNPTVTVPTAGQQTALTALQEQLDRCDTDEERLELLSDTLGKYLETTEELLRIVGRAVDKHKRFTCTVEDIRDTLARSMFESGVPVTRIAKAARLTDSHMGRRIRRAGRRQPRGRHA